MNNKYILLWLESPLQSWGTDSKFYRRDTINFPTKSGVLGLLCSALGAGGEQVELLGSMSQLSQTVISFAQTYHNKNRILVKREKEPLLRDFHVVGSGYDRQDLWENLLIPKTTEGKNPSTGGNKVTYRYYLQDSAFAVALEVPGCKADILANALQNPVWDLYLGRKNCIPTDFIYRGVFATEAEAIEQSMILANSKLLVEEFKVLDGEHEGEVLILNDIPLSFGEHKQYRDRRVTVVSP